MTKQELLQQISFGKRVAEEEREELVNYFVETDQWRRIFAGEVDVVYGPKGSGKSALHAALLARTLALFGRNIIPIAAENPRGAPVFKDLVDDPPASEREFISLWKLYILSLAAAVLQEYRASTDSAKQVITRLSEAGLVLASPERNLRALLSSVAAFVRRWFRSVQLESDVKLDAAGNIAGFGGRLSFKEPKPDVAQRGIASVDQLLSLAEVAFAELGSDLWILLDRLDVAFSESHELEENALRALFKVYLDLHALPRLKLKIFLRSDIWRRITTAGFREASHITRTVTIKWDRASLLNLVVRRALQTPPLVERMGVTPATVLQSYEAQEAFFYRLFPQKVELGEKQPTTLDWMLGRTRDGTQQNAPRELIHLLLSAKDVQLQMMQTGQGEPPDAQLFSSAAVKGALPEVSHVRLEQTLYAEYPSLREPLEKLRREKTLHTPTTLAAVWKVPLEEAAKLAAELVSVGFFEERGSRDAPEYWVPFLYRDALDLVQGRAD